MVQWSVRLAVAVVLGCALLVGCDDSGPAKALLWRIERPGFETSYLFGTAHTSEPDLADPSPIVLVALLQSDLLLSEVPPDFVRQFELKDAYSRLTPEERAEGALDKALLEALIAAAACYGLDEQEVRAAPLWHLVGLLALNGAGTMREERMRRAEGARTLDDELTYIAFRAEKLILPLEPFDTAIDVFRTMPSADQIAILRSIAGASECPPDDRAAYDLYREHDIEAMRALVEEIIQTSEDPELWRRFYRRLRADRNVKMVKRIEMDTKFHSAFIATGAGHLPGEDGLLALLRRRGWTVEPIE
jgi:uncharacterized protein